MKITIEGQEAAQDIEVTIVCVRADRRVLDIAARLRMLDRKVTGTADGCTRVLSAEDVLFIESVDKRTFIYTADTVLETGLRLPWRRSGACLWATLERLEIDLGMPQARLAVPPARVLDERAARHCLSQGARRAHHDAGLLPADEDGGPRPAARELGLQPVGAVRPHEGDHVPL